MATPHMVTTSLSANLKSYFTHTTQFQKAQKMEGQMSLRFLSKYSLHSRIYSVA